MTSAVLPHGMRRRLAGVGVAALLALGVVAVTPTQALAGPNEGDFFSAVNASRSAAGLRPYVWSSDLAAVARAQAERMGTSGRLEHNPNLGTDVTGWQIVAENIGYGPDWSSIEDAFMASPEHRANILDQQLTQLGVGTYVDAKGTLWVSQVFRLPYGATATGGGSGSGSGSASGASSGAAVTASTGATSMVPQPSPEQLLRERIVTARDKVAKQVSGHSDPLTDALAFATVMATVAG